MVQLGQKIKQLRIMRGMNQVQLAQAIGVDNSLICKLESGETGGSIATIRKIATALGVKLSDLLEDQAS